ncbi:HDIG domain-containing protein [Candidatus Woesearchaeota archaeon]|nr:HDIG domain-containing protein [Candidatus Woesearchaeota archaeon]
MTDLPTRKQCMELLDEHEVPENVRKHSFCVNKVAVFLARRLKEKGIDIDVELVDRASLLHDLDKIATLGQGNHGQLSKKILSERGYKRLADIVGNHVFEAVLDENLSTWEDKVVNYADKRCTEDKIVSLDGRFAYGRKTYPNHDIDKTEEAESLFRSLEKEIFNIIGLDPNSLGEYVESEVKQRDN